MLDCCRKLAALAQTGLTFSANPFDHERYTTLQQLAMTMLQQVTQLPGEQWQVLLGSEKGYATPKVEVRAAVFKHDTILLVHEKSDGLWAMPGGYAEVNEPPSVCVAREVQEETGYLVAPYKLIAVYDSLVQQHPPQPFHYYKLYFLCHLLPGSVPVQDYETFGCDFFPLPALPPSRSMAGR